MSVINTTKYAGAFLHTSAVQVTRKEQVYSLYRHIKEEDQELG